MPTLAAFIDLNCIRLGEKMLEKLLNDSSCQIIHLCLYNYDEKRYSSFAPLIARYNAKTMPLADGRKRIRTDMRLAVDSVAICEKHRPDKVLILCGSIDREALVFRLSQAVEQVVVAAEYIPEKESDAYKTLENKFTFVSVQRSVQLEASANTQNGNSGTHTEFLESDFTKYGQTQNQISKCMQSAKAVSHNQLEYPPDENIEIGVNPPLPVGNPFLPTDDQEKNQLKTLQRIKATQQKNADVNTQKHLITEKLLQAIAQSKMSGSQKTQALQEIEQIKGVLLQLLAKERGDIDALKSKGI